MIHVGVLFRVCGDKQATTDNTGPRTVEVQVELGGRGGSFLVVRDNGKGMNASDLKDFATYFLTQVWGCMHLFTSIARFVG